VDYAVVYRRLVERAKIRPKPPVFERHHIIPKCVGGSCGKENLVLLTPREHLFAHKLLVRIYPQNRGLWFALILMGRLVQYKSKIFESERIRVKQLRKEFRYTEEAKKKMSASAEKRGRNSPATEFKKGLVPWNKGLPVEKSHRFGKRHSEETIARMRATQQRLREEQSVRMTAWWAARKLSQPIEVERKIS
jgi:hypothetical protein